MGFFSSIFGSGSEGSSEGSGQGKYKENKKKTKEQKDDDSFLDFMIMCDIIDENDK